MQVLGTPTERVEQRFRPLLELARGLVRLYEDAFFDVHPRESMAGDAFPEATVARLMIATTPLFEAAVASLDDSRTSLGAYVLLRTLIENWARMQYLFEAPETEGICRAIRLELRTATYRVKMVEESDDLPGSAQQLATARRLLDDVRRYIAIHGCEEGVAFPSTTRLVKALAEHVGDNVLVGAWRAASATAHGDGWEWIVQPRRTSDPLASGMPPSNRAARLNHLVVMFFGMAVTALSIVGAEKAAIDALEERCRAVWDSAFLRRAVEGDYD
ncbi:MAG: hypothetical protein JWO62_2272 [Acidimicrobiaceae bacterium]|nr:hypothetical protein [Acidimicrobiaceae bacterium]